MMQLFHQISNTPGNCNGVDVSVESPAGDIAIIVKLVQQCFIRFIFNTLKKKYENRGVQNMVSLPCSLAI